MDGDIRDANLTLREIRDDWGGIRITEGLPLRVSPMDADGLIELDGHMVLIERDRYGNITYGQTRVLSAFSTKPGCESWYVRGPKNTFPIVRIYRGGTIDEGHDWSSQPVETQVHNMTALFADFTRRAGRQPRDPKFQRP